MVNATQLLVLMQETQDSKEKMLVWRSSSEGCGDFYVCFHIEHSVSGVWLESQRKTVFGSFRLGRVLEIQRTHGQEIFGAKKMNFFNKIAMAAAALVAAQGAFANVLQPNAVPEPGALGLVGVALAAAVYFGKRRK